MNMTQSEHRTDPGLATALRISVSRLARRLRVERAAAGLGEPDLSETQLAALATLDRHGAMTPGELAEHEKVQPPSMTRVISVLVDSQLVRREPHASDRRQVVLTATDAGHGLVIKARKRREAWLAQRLREPLPKAAAGRGSRPSGPCPPGTTGCTPAGRWSPTQAPGCSGLPRTGWSCN
jgi:DNA-binding MarR family transcriptional regulator